MSIQYPDKCVISAADRNILIDMGIVSQWQHGIVSSMDYKHTRVGEILTTIDEMVRPDGTQPDDSIDAVIQRLFFQINANKSIGAVSKVIFKRIAIFTCVVI